jgi:diguanylate cyclase (GGDEF)-like protein
MSKKSINKSTIKIKDTEQMHEYLSSVFSDSVLNCQYAYLIEEDDSAIFYGGSQSLNEKELIAKARKLLHKDVGDICEIDEHHILVPIFQSDESIEFLIIESLVETKKFLENEFLDILKNIHIYRQLKLRCERLMHLSHIDEVTGLFNQRKLVKDLESTIKSHEEENESFSLLFVDIDHFKSVNDNFGHLIGSEILADLGDLLKSLVRGTDDVYRFGGDEFIVILREVDIDTVHRIGVRLLKTIKDHHFELETGESYKMSVSMGIAEYPTDAKTSKEMIQMADEMMYKSKETGRGKVIHLGREVKNVNANTK